MSKLKVLLQCKYLYIIILICSIIYFFIYNSFTYTSKIKDNNGIFTIYDISYKNNYIIKLRSDDEKIIAFYYGDSFDFKLGDQVLISFNDIDIKENTLPNTFNYKEYLYHKHIYKAIEIKEISMIEKNNNIIFLIKNYIYKRVSALNNGKFILSFLFNYDYDIDIYREAGISHLFAISGLHVSFLLLVLRKIFGRFRKCFIIFSFLLLGSYLVILNYPISLLRCLLFLLLLFLNKMFCFNIKKIYLLLLAVGILIFVDPFYIFDIGFLFSCSITFFLICFGYKGNGYSKSIIYNSILCFLASFPILINNFYEVNFMSIVNNLFSIPLISFIVLPLSILTIFFPFLSFILSFFIDIFNSFINFSNSFLSLNVIFCKQSLLFIAIYYVSMLISYFYKKWWLFFILLIVIITWYYMPFSRSSKIMFIDVGEGDSSLIQVNDSVNIIDTGGIYIKDDSKYTYKLSKSLISYLKSMGIRKIDNLFLTHGDRDHIKEASYLIENFKVINVYFNSNCISNYEEDIIKSCKSNRTNYFFMKANDYVLIDNYKIININSRLSDDENESSLVLYFKYNNFKALFMGDATKDVEEDIINNYSFNNIDLLKIAHHGSKTSSSELFLDYVKPNICVISVGLNNRYGHPNKDVIDRLKSCNIYRTDINGSIEVLLNKNKYNINVYK